MSEHRARQRDSARLGRFVAMVFGELGLLWFDDNHAATAVSRVEIAVAAMGHHAGRAVPAQTVKETAPMETSHVQALQQKHEGLDRRLREEMNRPAPDAAKIQAIKKQKLRLKEEIALH
ncbi:YdcH family protein [Aurantiacibacter hainanensis]|uniref:YdcH family protein n=1 Tax=Aurantiacibacter hainanensis TaxID=3076114 RepID=UPI003EB7EF62